MMEWKFCEFCYMNGRCENQDRGYKCECYGKKLEDKCERLEKQLAIAVEALDFQMNYGEDYNDDQLAKEALEKIKALDKTN